MIRKEKRLDEKKIIIDLSTFGSKIFMTLKIMDFENVPLIKVVHVYVIKGMNT
jgi:hypothetical protein